MNPIKEIIKSTLQMQIIQIQCRIEEMRLERFPDVESIRSLEENAKSIREFLLKMDEPREERVV